MKIGDKVLYKNKDELAFKKGFIVDGLFGGRMVSLSTSLYGEAVYYLDIESLDIKIIEDKDSQ